MIAFTVAHGEPKTYTAGQRIEFPTVITNEGGGYVSSQHEFICPRTGVYMFSVSVVRTPANSAILKIFMDDTLLVAAFAAGSSNAATSNTVFVRCNSGGSVYVQCYTQGSCSVRSNNLYYDNNATTFSGMLVAADD